MKLRIDLSKIELRKVKANLDHTTQPEEPSEPMARSQASSNTDYEIPNGYKPIFELQAHPLTGWTSPLHDYPIGDMNYDVPEKDLPRVKAWFTGQYGGVTEGASSTLIRNVTNAGKTALSNYFTAANEARRFTSPFKISWAYRFKDGNRLMMEDMQLMSPNTRAPILTLEEYTLLEDSVVSKVGIHNTATTLKFRSTMNPGFIYWGDVTHIDIIATPQVDLIPDDFQITEVGTVTIDGVNKSSYLYIRPTQETVEGTALLQTDSRIIASVPVLELPNTQLEDVPILGGAFTNWKQLEKYTEKGSGDSGDDNPDNPDDPDDPDNPDEPDNSDNPWYPYVNVETEPLDLGDPERRKWVRSVWLRGLYERDKVSIKLYGSRHRDDWHLLAQGKRGWIGGLAGAGFKWWKVQITGPMRKGDFPDALSFDFHK